MTFDFSDEQVALRAAVRDLLDDHSGHDDDPSDLDRKLWDLLSGQLGVVGLAVPERHGGAGAGPVELAVVAEEMGRRLCGVPYLSSAVLAATLLSELAAGPAEQYLPDVGSGRRIATVAIAGDDGWDLRGTGVVAADSGTAVSGRRRWVTDGPLADLLLVVAEGPRVLAVDAAASGVTVTALGTLDATRPLADVTFDAAPARLLAEGPDAARALERALRTAGVVLAAEQAGGARAVLDAAVAYAKERVQFGRAIGSFQAVKHLCADLLVDVESAYSAAYRAAWALAEDRPDAAAVASMAQAFCSEVFVRAAGDNIQIHGGIGFTWEHPAHRYLRRARSSAALFGSPAAHREGYLSAVEDGVATSTDTASASASGPDTVSTEAGGVRAEVRAWLAEHWGSGIESSGTEDRDAWRERVVDAGYAVPRWPREALGLGMSDADADAVEEEFRTAGAPGSGQDRVNLWANTVLAFGTPELRAELLRPLLLDRITMCLLYSEPGAGSDLAAVRTTAVADGDGFVVDGQKVWTSNAARADYGMLLARTDPDVPKHRGLSFFFLPMNQEGVEVRPLRQMTGEAHFNEVFLTGARVAATHMLGAPGQGWRVLQTALAYERAALAESNIGASVRSGRAVDASGDVDLVALARRYGCIGDRRIRDDIARLLTLRAVNRWNNQRAQAELEQGTSSPVASLGKLAMSRMVHLDGAVQTAIVGPEAMLEGSAHPDGDEANFAAMNAYFTSIGGGTDQIQRSIVGERILGLPKEPEVDKDVPFRQVRSSG
ncbi:acyl-CoA dehydrogenase [Pseudonocardia sp. KRD291]|uniref:acyl-CoA dehydrogenase n=1 Tax=Pseudonocardia sp. KRD291 TaxID=2792007 RepID=UPI001C5C0CF6|nr:acyl-CoA dehydrogenase [Pseudonocardia sp. KRD291]MBW0103675.1 acyl-CoA dehydrogenase [Pseudonocardia sp. KRD291]